MLRDLVPADYSKLADMWNKSNEGWPLGTTAGIDLTEESIRRELERISAIGRFVWEEEGEIVGFVEVRFV